MDKRLLLVEINMCEECIYFTNNVHSSGSAKYSCAHPHGPGGRLSEEIIMDRIIHQDCPLVKVNK